MTKFVYYRIGTSDFNPKRMQFEFIFCKSISVIMYALAILKAVNFLIILYTVCLINLIDHPYLPLGYLNNDKVSKLSRGLQKRGFIYLFYDSALISS